MSRFKVPAWVKKHNIEYDDFRKIPGSKLHELSDNLRKFREQNPLVSIVIPAYNEEKNIIRTLSSLSDIKTHYPVEILVINNNSTDRTQEILDLLGVKSVFEKRQGISFTRQTGLEKAKGRYILNADSDTIYPSGWVDTFVAKLKNPDVSCVYGRYSFIPGTGSTRFKLGLYEIMAEAIFRLRRKKRDYLNVLGFNFAFRKADGIKVGGFNINRQRWQDGWMAMQLMKLGKIELVTSIDARTWTSDRRLMYDGGLFQAFAKRAKIQLSRMKEYLLGKKNVQYVEPGQA
jgi:glycosyltransferase involved in cell wall biosynthesis